MSHSEHALHLPDFGVHHSDHTLHAPSLFNDPSALHFSGGERLNEPQAHCHDSAYHLLPSHSLHFDPPYPTDLHLGHVPGVFSVNHEVGVVGPLGVGHGWNSHAGDYWTAGTPQGLVSVQVFHHSDGPDLFCTTTASPPVALPLPGPLAVPLSYSHTECDDHSKTHCISAVYGAVPYNAFSACYTEGQ